LLLVVDDSAVHFLFSGPFSMLAARGTEIGRLRALTIVKIEISANQITGT
jgi:hypothetical protein